MITVNIFYKMLEKIEIISKQNNNFIENSKEINEFIKNITKEELLVLLREIGTIPESIKHDSTEEKLFSKASNCILSRAFIEIGLKSNILTEISDSADIIVESIFHNYTLVADAKAFRMSRTAKNQKDFKVKALSSWRKDNDYAVLCSPYFQYPVKESQIYKQSLEDNVCLFSWEYFIFLIENNIVESNEVSFASIWDFSNNFEINGTMKKAKNSFIGELDNKILELVNNQKIYCEFKAIIEQQIKSLTDRGNIEKKFWKEEENRIRNLTYEKAIEELIITKKLNNKIKQIEKYIGDLKKYV
ncbi:HindIII family type II restriction endonuclease [Leptotrichia trevisanii]|uniref:HindIII family type II restriction endonuclease n=1 Tax=Leptotrichia trevisanii TaxID=109328 RepID=UPI0012D35468|nr:HindIII family type II restriction endonuclease [Leptotrichia trevisanii]